jgi:hypothetical protein
MSWQLIVLLGGIAFALLVAAYTAGEWRGQRTAVEELWDTAMALGAYGQLLRMQADIEGVTVPELLDRERRSGQ